MKPLPTLPLLLCTLAVPLNAAHWPLDSAKDTRHLIHGDALAAKGVEGPSLVLDGVSVIELKDSAALNGGNVGFTISVWFNPYALDGGQQMLVGKNRYSLDERQWGISIEPNGRLKAHLRQNGWREISSQEPLQAGHWHLATLSVGAGKAALYLNGKPTGEVKLTQPLPTTQAPITLGGIHDAGQAKQTFHGALDEARYEPHMMSAAEVAASYTPVLATHEVPKPVKPFAFWDASQPLAKADELPVVEGAEFHVIKKWDKPADGYTFLHGVGLAWHKGKLYASIGHNQGEENTVTEEAQYRVSEGGGETWSELRVIDAGVEENLAISHGVFLSHAGKLWAFHGAYYGKMERIHTRAYSLDETTGQWVKHGVVIENGFWALNQPVKMADGNWIMPGISAGVYSENNINPAAVAISNGDDLTKWKFVAIPVGKGIKKMWGESSLFVADATVYNIARYGGGAAALVAISQDYGRTWTPSQISDLPMTTSKPAAGILSTGQRYLVCTTAKDNGGKRTPLTIAVSRPGENVFAKVFVIRRSLHPGQPGESADSLALSYPCATEHEGKLYVGYSNNGGRRGNNNSAELAIIPIESLRVNP